MNSDSQKSVSPWAVVAFLLVVVIVIAVLCLIFWPPSDPKGPKNSLEEKEAKQTAKEEPNPPEYGEQLTHSLTTDFKPVEGKVDPDLMTSGATVDTLDHVLEGEKTKGKPKLDSLRPKHHDKSNFSTSDLTQSL